jgi:hypothetical protein
MKIAYSISDEGRVQFLTHPKVRNKMGEFTFEKKFAWKLNENDIESIPPHYTAEDIDFDFSTLRIRNEYKPGNTVLDFLIDLNKLYWWCSPRQSEKTFERMSNSDLRRLCEQGGIHINNCQVDPDELFDFRLESIIMYPSSNEKRNTIW